MIQDYDSIKSDYDIVTILLKGPMVVPFQIDVLRSRKIGSISRYLCEYRGLSPNSFLLFDNNNKKIIDNETIADICDSKQLKIFISIKKNIGGYNKNSKSIPENGDYGSLNSEMKNNNSSKYDTGIYREIDINTKKKLELKDIERSKNRDHVEVDEFEKNGKQDNPKNSVHIIQNKPFLDYKNPKLKKERGRRKNETNDINSELKNNTAFVKKYKCPNSIPLEQNKSFTAGDRYLETRDNDQCFSLFTKSNLNKN